MDASAEGRAPFRRELDWLDPDHAFAVLADAPHPVWLDSGGPVEPRSRFSFLAVDPVRVVELPPGDARNPFAVLAGLAASLPPPIDAAPFPFAGGVVGTLGYDARLHAEVLPDRHRADPALPMFWAAVYDLVLAWDRRDRRCVLFSSGLPERDAVARRARAARRADALSRRLCRPAPAPEPIPDLFWRPTLPPGGFERAVSRCVGMIRAGELFQANVTERFVASRPPGLHLPSLQRALRRATPAPFAAFVGWDADRALLSVSPERFLRLDADGAVETRPIKGTRPRRADARADRAEAAALLASEKDRAENLMIVDLMRNDLSRVCRPGSVSVPALCVLESFPAVHHLVSAVRGRLQPGLGAVDLLRACFPGGSVTGAPKIRAMQAIDVLEASARGPYCGAVFRIGLDGALDSSIVIRSVAATPDRLVLGAGGGITAESDPAAEYAEMRVKADPLMSAAGRSP